MRIQSQLKELSEEYGFGFLSLKDKCMITVKNKLGNEEIWITYYYNHDKVVVEGDSVQLDLVTFELTQEDIYQFINRLNVIFEIEDTPIQRIDLIANIDWVEMKFSTVDTQEKERLNILKEVLESIDLVAISAPSILKDIYIYDNSNYLSSERALLLIEKLKTISNWDLDIEETLSLIMINYDVALLNYIKN